MSKYLESKNKEFKSKQFNELYINDLLSVYQETNDEFQNLIRRYFFVKSKDFKINNDELTIVESLIDYNNHILIRVFLEYLIATSKKSTSSKLVEECKNYIQEYFNNTENITNGLSNYNLITILTWTLWKFPKEKNKIGMFLFDKIINRSDKQINILYLVNSIIGNKDLQRVFSFEQYYEVYNKYLPKQADKSNIQIYLDVYERYYEYFIQKSAPKIMRNQIKKNFCDFVIYNIEFIDNYRKQIILQKIRKHMNELKSYEDSDYYIIDSHLEIANKETLDSLKFKEFRLPPEQINIIEEVIENQKDYFSRLDSETLINKLLADLDPIITKDIEKHIRNKGDYIFTSLMDEKIIDSKGRIMNYDKISDNQMFSLKANEHIYLKIKTVFSFYIYPFFQVLSSDDSHIELTIKKILTNNLLVSNDKIEILCDSFSSFLKRDFKNSVYDIVLELEESLRYFFKNKKMNIYKLNSKNDLIGLSNILNDDKKNKYRDEMLKIIDEDFYFTLKWFLVDEYGFALRHKIAHRYDINYLYNTEYAIFIVFQIIRLYWGFQK